MRITTLFNIISAVLLVWMHSRVPISCNPIAFDPTAAPLAMSMPPIPMPLQIPMLMSSQQFDPYASQYFMASPFGPMPFDADRRSPIPSMFRANEKGNNNKKSNNDDLSDEQKALGDLPVSFIDPEGPSTISERLSDSFSALGEGVRNHFRSLTENFSDTMDDIKDAWRSSDNSKKRG